MFFRGSRYEGVPDAQLERADGRILRYKRIRFVPAGTGTLPYVVTADDRPDLIAHKAFNDPEQYWRLCDANDVMHPEELVAAVGRRILVPGPTG